MISKLFKSFIPLGRKFSDLALKNCTAKLDRNTLTGRILLYFDPNLSEENKIVKNEEVQILHYIKKGTNCNLHTKSTEELKNLFLLSNNNINNRNEFLNAIKVLDSECCSRLNKLKTEEILEILRFYAKVIPSQLNKYAFYETAIDKLNETLDTLTKNELLQLMFFVGQQKTNKKSQYILRRCMKRVDENFIKSLSAEELCIICNATFKTTTRISNKLFLDNVKAFINDNLYILKDPAIFITLVKTIRQNQCQDDNVLSTISCAVFFNKTLQYYSFAGMCHILALYADYKYYDENIVKHFSIKCLDELKKSKLVHRSTYLTEQIRDKDLERFLWCLSTLGFNLDTDTIRIDIIPKIIERIRNGHLKEDPHLMVNIILYLWIINYQAVELLPYVLLEKHINAICTSQLTRRLNILLTAIFFENRPVFKDYNIKIKVNSTFDKEKQVRRRPILQRVFENLKVILPKTELTKFELSCQIPYFDIVGITGFKKNIYKVVNIEILDEFTCLKNTEFKPTGIMQMKLRILNGFEEGLITIKEKDIQDMTEAELQNYLLDEILLIT